MSLVPYASSIGAYYGQKYIRDVRGRLQARAVQHAKQYAQRNLNYENINTGLQYLKRKLPKLPDFKRKPTAATPPVSLLQKNKQMVAHASYTKTVSLETYSTGNSGYTFGNHSQGGVIMERHDAGTAATSLGVNNVLYLNTTSYPIDTAQYAVFMALVKTVLGKTFKWNCSDLTDSVITTTTTTVYEPNVIPLYRTGAGVQYTNFGLSFNYRQGSGTAVTETAIAWYPLGTNWYDYMTIFAGTYSALTVATMGALNDFININVHLATSDVGANPVVYKSYLVDDFNVALDVHSNINFQNRSLDAAASTSTDTNSNCPLQCFRLLGSGTNLVPVARKNIATEVYASNNATGASWFSGLADKALGSEPAKSHFKNAVSRAVSVIAPGEIFDAPLKYGMSKKLGTWLKQAPYHGGMDGSGWHKFGNCQTLFFQKVLEISADGAISLAYEQHVKYGCTITHSTKKKTQGYVIAFS